MFESLHSDQPKSPRKRAFFICANGRTKTSPTDSPGDWNSNPSESRRRLQILDFGLLKPTAKTKRAADTRKEQLEMPSSLLAGQVGYWAAIWGTSDN
ncbi:hypothetical protein [Rhizobium sp. IBUN]|uniref:hypothetical protein n=1 Tax=Rhizobium sp. IBUN TaxID=1042326 RepID=UPI0012EBD3A9|nr:hypothetical protein [Rhizobium sp. IBUN]